MPSPIGHALAGAAIALSAHPTLARRGVPDGEPAAAGWSWPALDLRLLLLCMTLAALPDADLLTPVRHRTATHSLISIVVVTIVATAVTGWVTPRRAVRMGLLCGAAWGSHVLLDWLGADPNPPGGIQALWPFSDQWFKTGWDLFPTTERRNLFSMATFLVNAKAAVFEILSMGSLVFAVWLARVRGI